MFSSKLVTRDDILLKVISIFTVTIKGNSNKQKVLEVIKSIKSLRLDEKGNDELAELKATAWLQLKH
jgi:hypothetical protein